MTVESDNVALLRDAYSQWVNEKGPVSSVS